MHTIQTNGTLLDDAWAAFFAEHGFLVGLSIDGPPEVHDTYRVDKGGKGSFARVMRGLATLQRNGVEWNALTTVHAANQDRGRETYLFLRDQCGARFITMIDLITSPQQAKFGLAKRDTLPGFCRRCDVRFACHGGCPKDRFTSTPDGEPGLHSGPSRSRYTGWRRCAACCSPARLPRQITDRYAKADAKRGRNEPCPCGWAGNGTKRHGAQAATTSPKPAVREGNKGSIQCLSARPLRRLRYQRTSVPDGKSSTQPTSS